MAKTLSENNGKRVIFPNGQQREFLARALEKSCLQAKELSELLSVHPRTLNGWRNENSSLPLFILEAICDKFKILHPKEIEIRDAFWSTKKAASLGGHATFEKYGSVGGDPEYRKQEWQKWWKKNGHKNLPNSFQSLKIKTLRKNSDLAEFIGIILGDGHVALSQITITLNATDDAQYAQYVIALIAKLSGVTPSISKRKNMNAVVISISRKKLVDYLLTIGLSSGNKTTQQVDIPDWIKKSQTFSKLCVRGLVDTDGCVVNECHKIKSKTYCYPRIAFTNASQPLLRSVYKILEGLAFSPKMRNNKRVQIERSEEIRRYFKVIGTSNPKHLARFKKFGLRK
ncbi:MAG: LAGLIDADG family homing endonuclease [Candidatus Paceibacterota bacterium]|jgi:hypothetical protein